MLLIRWCVVLSVLVYRVELSGRALRTRPRRESKRGRRAEKPSQVKNLPRLGFPIGRPSMYECSTSILLLLLPLLFRCASNSLRQEEGLVSLPLMDVDALSHLRHFFEPIMNFEPARQQGSPSCQSPRDNPSFLLPTLSPVLHPGVYFITCSYLHRVGNTPDNRRISPVF